MDAPDDPQQEARILRRSCTAHWPVVTVLPRPSSSSATRAACCTCSNVRRAILSSRSTCARRHSASRSSICAGRPGRSRASRRLSARHAVNLAIADARKKHAPRDDSRLRRHRPVADPTAGPFENVSTEQVRASVRRLLDELPVQRDREILLRFYLNDQDKT